MNRIKEVLHEQGRSQAWLSEKSGIRYTIITNYCNNRTQPDKEILTRIASVLEIETDKLKEKS